MTSSQPPSGDDNHHAGHLVPILCLIGVVALLSSITPVMKNVFLHSEMSFVDIARERVHIGFLILAGMTVCLDWRGVRALRFQDSLHLAGVGVLGVASYTIAAWGLMYTSVTHYALVYSLLPTFTAIFSYCLGRQHTNPLTWFGILLSWVGCAVAISGGGGPQAADFGLGDALALLFTLMMSVHIVMSPHVVKQHGVLTSNTVMFGASALFLWAGSIIWGTGSQQESFSLNVAGSVLFIGAGTAGVFLLRSRSLRSLPPTMVGAYHNLIPICTIGIAHFSLDEPLPLSTILGAIAVLLGSELVRRASSFGFSLTWPSWGVRRDLAPTWTAAPAAIRSYSKRFHR